MSADYAPGTVAVATVDGVADQLIWRTECDEWVTTGGGGLEDDDVTDARPLVTLDFGINGGTAHLPCWMRDAAQVIADAHPNGARGQVVACLLTIADQIEAQTKPPRIPELGLWGVVEASPRTGFTGKEIGS